MKSSKIRRANSKKEKLSKLIKNDDDSDGGESEHELSHYLNDRVKLMKEVLKIIKPKKIRAMAPDCMQKMDGEEINSMLLDELLGISNKRLKYVFNGQNLNEESSSTDPEEEQAIDIISLDDISDDEFIIDLDSDAASKKKHRRHKTKIKEEPKKKRVKKEKSDKIRNPEESLNQMSEQNLMSVLELLELQARARAIRSQLVLESSKKAEEAAEAAKTLAEVESSDNEDAVIVESPENVEIIITSSDSENEHVQNLQQVQNHQFRRDTDDGSGKDCNKTVEIIQKSITNDKYKSHMCKDRKEINKNTPSDIEDISKDSNAVVRDEISLPKGISDQSCQSPTNNFKNADEVDKLSNKEETVGVVDIPLPKDYNNHADGVATPINSTKIISEGSDHQSKEKTKKLESHANIIKSKETSKLESAEETNKNSHEKDDQMAGENSERKLLKESDNSNSKEASSSVEYMPHSKMKTTSQEVKLQMRNDCCRSKGQEDESGIESNAKRNVAKTDNGLKKDKSSRVCRRKLSKLAKEKADNTESIQTSPTKSSMGTIRNEGRSPVKERDGKKLHENVQEKNNRTDESDGIILNVDQSEMDCIHLD